MAYVLAVDVGASQIKSAVAEWSHEGLHEARLVSLGSSGFTVPNVLFFAEDGLTFVGEEAEAHGLEDPERLIRAYKHRVGDPVPMRVGGNRVSAEHMLAVATRWAVDRVKELEGSDPASLIVSYPTGWGDYRTGLVRDALTTVGLDEVTLVSEATAAVSYFASKRDIAPGSVIAICSLGAGFSTAVLKKDGDGAFSLLSHGEHLDKLGGTNFDDAVLDHVTHTANGAIPSHSPADAQPAPALAQLRRHCVEAKEELSTHPETTILVSLPGSQLQVRLTREEFEDSIRDQIDEIVVELLGTVDRAAVEREDLAAVVLTGGSSRIPFIAQLVSERTTRPVFVDGESNAAVSLGAVSAAEPAVVSEPTANEASTNVLAQLATTGTVPADWARPRRKRKSRPFVRPVVRVASQRSWVRIAVGGAVALLSVLALTGAQGPRAMEPLTALEAITGQAAPMPPAGVRQLPEPMPATEAGLDVSASPKDTQPGPSTPGLVPFPGQRPGVPPPATFPPAPGGPTDDASNGQVGLKLPGAETPPGQNLDPVPQPAATPGTDVAPVPVIPSDAPASPGTTEPELVPEPPPSDPGLLPDVLHTTPDLVE